VLRRGAYHPCALSAQRACNTPAGVWFVRRETVLIDIHTAVAAVGSWRRLSVFAAALMVVAVACSNGDDDSTATAAPAEPTTTEAPAVDAETEDEADSEPTTGEAAPTDAIAAGLGFGSGSGSITLGGETFEFAIAPGAGLCRDVFGIIQAGGSVADERDIDGEFMIPPLDWETYSDGRYDPPSVQLKITSTGDDNARWRADAGWAQENDKVGMSQVDSYEKDGQTASGSATFANSWNSDAESVRGSFEISCSEV
jgi:hypothetical protein